MDVLEDRANNVIAIASPHGYASLTGTYDCCNPTEGTEYGYGPQASSLTYQPATVTDPKVPGDWDNQINWRGNCPTLQESGSGVYMTNNSTATWDCFHFPGETNGESYISTVTPSSLDTSSLPTSVTISAAIEGPTQVYIYGGPGDYAAVTPTSTTASSATFTFPVDNSKGNPFPAGTFAITVYSGPQGQEPVETGLGEFVAYGSSTIPGAFGVAAQDRTTIDFIGTRSGPHEPCIYHSEGAVDATYPVVTSYTTGELYYVGYAIPVGLNPTSVALYDEQASGGGPTSSCAPYSRVTQYARAVVTNSASGSVTIVNLSTAEALATVSVGETPGAVALGGDAADPVAYVANFNSGTVSVVDLDSMAVTNTISIGAYPDSITMDPSGDAFWVGGQNYIKEISTSNFAVLDTLAAKGYVDSVAVSQGQGQVVFSVSTGTDNPLAAYNATTAGQVMGTYSFPAAPAGGQPPSGCDGCQGGGGGSNALGPLSPETLCCHTGYIPLQAASALVSSTVNNSLAVEATPTGFALVSLVDNAVIYQGTTPSSVRGIAVAPGQSVGYLTVPDSNGLITLPIPSPN